MSLISTFSCAMAFCTSAACSGVSARVCSYLGCFFAYAQPTLDSQNQEGEGDLPKRHVQLLVISFRLSGHRLPCEVRG